MSARDQNQSNRCNSLRTIGARLRAVYVERRRDAGDSWPLPLPGPGVILVRGGWPGKFRMRDVDVFQQALGLPPVASRIGAVRCAGRPAGHPAGLRRRQRVYVPGQRSAGLQGHDTSNKTWRIAVRGSTGRAVWLSACPAGCTRTSRAGDQELPSRSRWLRVALARVRLRVGGVLPICARTRRVLNALVRTLGFVLGLIDEVWEYDAEGNLHLYRGTFHLERRGGRETVRAIMDDVFLRRVQ